MTIGTKQGMFLTLKKERGKKQRMRERKRNRHFKRQNYKQRKKYDTISHSKHPSIKWQYCEKKANP